MADDRKKTGKDRKSDRHRGHPTQVRMHPLIRQQLELLVERNATTMTAEITIAIREHLGRAGLWPPPRAD